MAQTNPTLTGNIYRDIAQRTGGDIYIGVVGPVRTGKSTFIRRFCEQLIIPAIENDFERDRVRDELPQSGSGRSVMTTQPKFVPGEAVSVRLEDTSVSVRMVDCVGYIVPDAVTGADGDTPRMVRTPWFDSEIPFEQAAELGTRKVIEEHSTVAVVVTTDGSVTGIDRDAYTAAEARVIAALAARPTPFVIILNTATPNAQQTRDLAAELSRRYARPVLPLDILNMTPENAAAIIESLLAEFPIRELRLSSPDWLTALGPQHPLCRRIITTIRETITAADAPMRRMRDRDMLTGVPADDPDFLPITHTAADPGKGVLEYALTPEPGVFYRILSEQSGCQVTDDAQLIALLRDFSQAKAQYDKLADALAEVERTGYGIVRPRPEELSLDEPEIVRQGSRFGVRLRASASGLHLIKVAMESEISPLVGTREQSEELADHLLESFENDPEAIWDTNIFGKPLYDLVRDEMIAKSNRLSPEVREKLRDTIKRVADEGCENLVCIML